MVVMISINVYLLAEKGLDVSRGLFFQLHFPRMNVSYEQ